ncbi:MAG TPA: PAS domain-containing protein [Polyangiaceae bacterium]
MFTRILEAALARIGDGVLVINPVGTPLFANDTAHRLLGRDPKACGLWPEGLLGAHSEDGQRALSIEELPTWQALRGEPVHDAPVLLRNAQLPEGAHLLVSAVPVLDDGCAVEAVVLVVRDVTSGRRTEEELTKTHVFLHSIVENLPAMIFVKEADSLRFELFNRAGEELLGIARSELLGKSDFDLFPADQARFFQARDRQALNSGGMVDITEEPIQTAEGERWLHTKKIPIRDAGGTPRYLLGISEDITDRRRAAEQLLRAKEELEQRVAERTAELTQKNIELERQIADRERAERTLGQTEQKLIHAQKMEAIGRLAGGVAHDLNNMLSAILGHVGLALNDVPAGGALREDLEQIKGAAERATVLTQQLLAYGRRQTMQPRIVDLNAVILETERMLRRVIGEDVELVVELESELWHVELDPLKIEQALLNLAANARDAMPGGGTLRIETRRVRLSANQPEGNPGALQGDYVLLAVSDSGVGMDEQTQANVFEPFFTTKTGQRGTGLGLATVYGVVVQSGGHITLSSEPGRGTTFCLYFPAQPGQRATLAPVPAELEPGALATILLVEDESLVRRAAFAILRRAGYSTLQAANGPSALAVAAAHPGTIELLLTDVIMPGMSGRELASRLHAARPTTRVLYMSGYTANVIGPEGVLPTDTAFIQKPFTPEALLSRVREVLSAQASLAAEQPQ